MTSHTLPTQIVHLPGPVAYREAHALQRALLEQRAAGTLGDVILLLEHAEVITVGRARGAAQSVLPGARAPVVAIERGGDATWHGPGQLVAYPIVGLQGARRDLHLHLRSLEDAVIGSLEALGLSPGRDPRNTGVWLPVPGSALPHKVCSVGIACRRWVTWHGLALNVSVAPEAWRQLRPCGFDPEVMTSLHDHLDPPPSIDALVPRLAARLCEALALPWDGEVRAAVEGARLPEP